MMRGNHKRNGAKPYFAMTLDELRAATRQYDVPTTGNELPGRPLSAAQQARFERVRGRGRPRVGRGAKVISLSVEKGLLAKADAAAKNIGISRAELFARGLRAVLAARR